MITYIYKGFVKDDFFYQHHVVVFVSMFEHLDFKSEMELKFKLVCSKHMLFLCIYDYYCCYCVIELHFDHF